MVNVIERLKGTKILKIRFPKTQFRKKEA